MRSNAKASSAGSSTHRAKGLGTLVCGAFAGRGDSCRTDGSGAPSRRFAISLCAVASALALLGIAAPADAALPIHAELPALGQSGFSRVCGLAVDSAGNRYVADLTTKEVKVFTPSGTEITHFTPSANNLEGTHGPCALAVDSEGNLYVNGRIADVVKYKPSSFPPTGSTTYAPDTSVNASGVLVSEGAKGVAVDPATDNVYVALEGHISSYQPDGAPISETIGNGVESANYTSVAVRGSAGKIYAYDSANAKAYVFSPDGTKVLTEVNGSTTAGGSFSEGAQSVALDQSNGHFYVSDINISTGHRVVDEFDSGGELVSELQVPAGLQEDNPTGLAVDNSSGANAGDVFVSAGRNPSSVFAFGPLTYAKFFDLQVAKGGAGKGTVTSSLVGIVCGASCKASFQEGAEVTLTATAETGSRFSSWQGCDSVAGNECTVTISAKRKVTANFTAKPTIESEDVRPRDTSAQLLAEINPNGEATSYQFEFLGEAAYQANGQSFSGPEEPLLVPASAEPIGAGSDPVSVSAEVPDLDPHTAYRFRVVASNAAGSSEGDAIAFLTYLPPHVFSPCANDGFRSGLGAVLPDCRAYEQASPVDKNFGDATGSKSYVRAADDGTRISFQTFGPIADEEGAQSLTPAYVASRGAEGWSTRGVAPPQTLALEAFMTNSTPDLRHVYSSGNLPGEPQTTTLIDRNMVNGAVNTIVPHTANFGRPIVQAMSDDGSAVLFEQDSKALVPGAAAGYRNLYVWDRDTGIYRLAGVLNDGKAPPTGVTAGAADIFPESAYSRDQRAISADGKVAYFTDNGPRQLYARVNPTQPQSDMATNGSGEEECTQPELACTYLVSRSQRATKGPDPAGAQPTRFRGATPDGSKAFFTGSEMLTDDANTGPEQPPSAIGRAKVSGSAAEDKELDFLPAHAIGTTIFGGYIYWADPNGGRIGRAKLSSDDPPTVVPNSVNPNFIEVGPTKFESHPFSEPGVLQPVPSQPRYVAVDSEYVYWTSTGLFGEEQKNGKIFGAIVDKSGTIGRAKLGPNGPVEVDPEFITGVSNPRGIALNAEHVYWSSTRRGGATGSNRSLGRATLEGEGVNEAYCSNDDLGFGGTTVIQSVTIQGGDAYLGLINEPQRTDGHGASIARAQLSTCHPLGRLYISGTGDIGGVATDGSYLYWALNGELAETGRATIGRIPVADFGNDCLQISNCDVDFMAFNGSLGGLFLDGDRLYWGMNGEVAPNPGADLYRYNVAADKLTDLTPDTNPADEEGADVQGVLGSSEDGSVVYFAANGVLADGASSGNCLIGDTKFPTRGRVTGKCNLYVASAGEIEFIARLNADAGDEANWSPQAPGANGIGGQEKTSRLSSDGSTLLFTSVEKLSRYKNKGKSELYRFQSTPGGHQIVCVSCVPTGLPPAGRWSLFSKEPEAAVRSPQTTATLARNLSADGNRLFFETAEKLVVEDTNGDDGCPLVEGSSTPVCQDVYEWEAKGTGTCDSEEQNGGCLYLISTGKSEQPSFFADASESGDDVFFFTRERLAGQDEDSFVDVYDARVGGGLSTQAGSSSPPPCEGEACKGGASAPPQAGTPTTSLFSGPGNPTPQHKKAKARKHKHKSHKHKRHAKHNGRAHR